MSVNTETSVIYNSLAKIFGFSSSEPDEER